MERYKKYFLNVWIILALCGACEPESKQTLFANLSQVQKDSLIHHYEKQYKNYYQASKGQQDAFDRLIELKPEEEFYYREKSVAHTKAGDYHIAFPLLEKSAELDPSASLYYYSWLLLDTYRDYERALQRLNEYDNLTPDQSDYAWGEHVNYLKGLAYKQLKRYPEAIREFNLCISDEGEQSVDVYAYVYRGLSYAGMNQFDKAIADYNRAIFYFPQCTMAFYYKAMALQQLNKPKEAVKALQKAKELYTKGYKKGNPYKEIFNEVHLEMINDQLALLHSQNKSS